MSEYTLYGFAQSGNAYKAALMLTLSKADWAPRFVDFLNGETRTPEFRALNEMGEVPVLVHGDQTLSQSGIILDYLAETLGRFGGQNADEKREIWRWILWDNHKLTGYTGTLRFMRAILKTGETPVTDFLEGRAKSAYKILDAHLQGRDWVAADRPTIADISLCGYLFWPEEIGVDFSAYTQIEAWLDRIRGLDGWVAPYDLLPGYPLPETT